MEKRYLAYVTFFLFFVIGCENQSSNDPEKPSKEMIIDDYNPQIEVFEPEISIDSLDKIEEELDEKLEDLGIS